ncbi:MAG TPA: hypothetical protein VK162_17345 [Streptosporangiaceae bacterium]|nr:hypothetical protein [Streptosporangiaceae bacterium]
MTSPHGRCPARPPPLVIEMTVSSGGSPPLHVHDGLDDSSYLLDGRLAGRCGEGRPRSATLTSPTTAAEHAA